MARTMQKLNKGGMMEEDEIEMTKDELQMWIRDRIQKMEVLPPQVLETCNRLQLLLEKREQQASRLLRLCESVTRCEVIVKKQCSLLGLEYRDTDSDDDDDNIRGCGNGPSPSEMKVLSSPAAPRNTSESFGENNKKNSFSIKRELKVALSRLSESQLAAVQPVVSQNQLQQQHEPEPMSDSGSDLDWEPQQDLNDPDYSSSHFRVRKKRKVDSKSESDSFDSDFSSPSFKTRPKRKRERVKTNEKPARSNRTDISTPEPSATAIAKSNAEKSISKPSSSSVSKGNTTGKSTSKPSSSTVSKGNITGKSTSKPSSTSVSKGNTTGKPTSKPSSTTVSKDNTTGKPTSKPSSTTISKGNTTGKPTSKPSSTTVSKDNTTGKSTSKPNAEKTSSPQLSTANTDCMSNTASPKTITVSNGYATKIPPPLQPDQVVVGMTVLARKNVMSWQRGKILEILTKEDGGLKYKVQFEEKGKILVSGHHIAFSTTPKVNHLYIGARVVVRSEEDTSQFRPGILAELPSRKNRSRFLIFDDGHVPVYVGLPLFHLVCRPLKEPLEDLPDGHHKIFMKQYIKDWPYPHLSQFRPEQTLNAEHKGVQQKCEVVALDCSLMQVVFEEDQHKTWLHRGSIRLQNVAMFLVNNAIMTEDDSE